MSNNESKSHYIHPTAVIEDEVTIGENTKIWHHSQVRKGAKIGKNCNFGKGVFIDAGVSIGDNVKIQNYISVYHGVTIEDDVFLGPHCVFTNDLFPRAVGDWELCETLVKKGASVGANATIRCGVTLGEYSLVGAGSVVTRDVPTHGLVYGNPARLHGYVCFCGNRLTGNPQQEEQTCSKCGKIIDLT